MRRGIKSPDAHLACQHQDGAQTLSKSLEEYYNANVGTVTRPSNLPPESATLFLCHDICHVIFGLATTPEDEALTDARTLLSSDVDIDQYIIFKTHDKQPKALFKLELGLRRSLRTAISVLPRIGSAAREAWRMKKRWPWVPPDTYLNQTLAELRDEFGIRVM